MTPDDTRPASDGGTWTDDGKCYDPPAPDTPVETLEWKLSPMEPTTAMLEHGRLAGLTDDLEPTTGEVEAVYRAMLDAAPQPSLQKVQTSPDLTTLRRDIDTALQQLDRAGVLPVQAATDILRRCATALSTHPQAVVGVAKAMQEEWDKICSDTGCHPLDIEQLDGELWFSSNHWTAAVAQRLSTLVSSPPVEAVTFTTNPPADTMSLETLAAVKAVVGAAAEKLRKPPVEVGELVGKAIEFYRGEAVAAQKHMASDNADALTAILTVLALDGGKRADLIASALTALAADRDRAIDAQQKAETALLLSDETLQYVSVTLGGPDEWTDQENMIYSVRETVAAANADRDAAIAARDAATELQNEATEYAAKIEASRDRLAKDLLKSRDKAAGYLHERDKLARESASNADHARLANENQASIAKALRSANERADRLARELEGAREALALCRNFAERELAQRGINDADYPDHARAGWIIDQIDRYRCDIEASRKHAADEAKITASSTSPLIRAALASGEAP